MKKILFILCFLLSSISYAEEVRVLGDGKISIGTQVLELNQNGYVDKSEILTIKKEYKFNNYIVETLNTEWIIYKAVNREYDFVEFIWKVMLKDEFYGVVYTKDNKFPKFIKARDICPSTKGVIK